jgi:thiol-disulfide isomerase/thioredoxin
MRTFLRSALVAAGIAAIYFIGSGARDFIAPVADGSAAPEFAGIDQWLNSPPLSLKALRGKVVLVDFWTYSCINCINTLPYVKQWHEKYKDQGLVIVGVHTPEYPFEKSTANVQTALKRFDIRYPVALDNSYGTWSAFHNQYWPATYLIDAEGRIVYQHFGEGRYAETEAAIRKLLTERK